MHGWMDGWINKCKDEWKNRHMGREWMNAWLPEILWRCYQYNEGPEKKRTLNITYGARTSHKI